jgi:hypothetical protein
MVHTKKKKDLWKELTHLLFFNYFHVYVVTSRNYKLVIMQLIDIFLINISVSIDLNYLSVCIYNLKKKLIAAMVVILTY